MPRSLKFLFALLIALLFFSCAPGEKKSVVNIPPHIIPPDSMVLILTDMQVTEAILREYQRTGREDEQRNKRYYHQVFEKYDLSNERYQQSIAFYEKNPDLYFEIYKDIVSLLTKMQAEEKAASEGKN
jgi:hypothetical protein